MRTPSFDVKILVEKVRIIRGYLRYLVLAVTWLGSGWTVRCAGCWWSRSRLRCGAPWRTRRWRSGLSRGTIWAVSASRPAAPTYRPSTETTSPSSQTPSNVSTISPRDWGRPKVLSSLWWKGSTPRKKIYLDHGPAGFSQPEDWNNLPWICCFCDATRSAHHAQESFS